MAKVSLSDMMNDDFTPDKSTNVVTPKNSGGISRNTTEVDIHEIDPNFGKAAPNPAEENYDELMNTLDNYLENEKRKVDATLAYVKEKNDEVVMAMEEAELAGQDVDSDNLEEVLEVYENANNASEKAINEAQATKEMDDLDVIFNDDDDEKEIDVMPNITANNQRDVVSNNKSVEDLSLDMLEDDTEEEETVAPANNNAVTVQEAAIVNEVPVVDPSDKVKKLDDATSAPTQVAPNKFDIEVGGHLPNETDDDLQSFLDEDAEETEDEKEERKKILKQFQQEVANKLTTSTITTKTGIKKFKISSTPISVHKVLKNTANSINTATWVLPNSGRLITLSAISGEEIENLSPTSHEDGLSDEMASRLTFNTLYNHLIDANKPDSMEAWLKTINWFDINDLYFAAYLATFKNSNFITYTCPNSKCNHMFLEEKKYTEMIKYADDEAKTVYNTIMKTGIDTTPDSISEEIIPINNNYAIGFRAPSIYDIIFGASSLDASFRTKYATTIGNISYMANIYYIGQTNGQDTLFPVDCKAVENDYAKTMRNKIVAYYNILKTLPSDEYAIVTRSIEEINSKNKVMATFHYPDHVCPKCGTAIKRQDDALNPLVMVFIRHQLVRLANSTIE